MKKYILFILLAFTASIYANSTFLFDVTNNSRYDLGVPDSNYGHTYFSQACSTVAGPPGPPTPMQGAIMANKKASYAIDFPDYSVANCGQAYPSGFFYLSPYGNIGNGYCNIGYTWTTWSQFHGGRPDVTLSTLHSGEVSCSETNGHVTIVNN